jgi:peptidylprolyl isomerase
MPRFAPHARSHRSTAWLLALGTSLALASCGKPEVVVPPPPPATSPTTWDLTRLGRLPPVQRESMTPEGVRLLVLKEGDGEPAGPNEPMDLRIVGRLRDGSTFLREVISVNRRPGQPSESRIAGFAPAMAGLRAGERRLALVPHPLGYGARPPSNLMPQHADLIFDVTRLRFRTQDLVVGLGEEVKEGATVLVQYRGTLEDGTVFDDSRTHPKGAPPPLRLGRAEDGRSGVIEGWIKGIPGMRVGGTRRLEIPSHLAYGERGSPNGKVPPHADLVFVVELLGVTAEEPARR